MIDVTVGLTGADVYCLFIVQDGGQPLAVSTHLTWRPSRTRERKGVREGKKESETRKVSERRKEGVTNLKLIPNSDNHGDV